MPPRGILAEWSGQTYAQFVRSLEDLFATAERPDLPLLAQKRVCDAILQRDYELKPEQRQRFEQVRKDLRARLSAAGFTRAWTG
ncbi:MAG: hypothetical protein IT428_18315 [Planctomycetaceae bacterium]|nr:hypothetical protein [Planctomycetaceae bacterium]